MQEQIVNFGSVYLAQSNEAKAMTNNLRCAIVSLLLLPMSFTAVAASDWTGQTPAPPVTGTLGPFGGGPFQSQTLVAACAPAMTPPPCTHSQTLTYAGSNTFTDISSIPPAAGQGSNLGVFITGTYQDPSSPTGLSSLDGFVPLDAFATSSSVDALNSTVGALSTSFNSLSATVGSLASSFNTLSATVGGLSASVAALQSQMTTVSSELSQFQRTLARQSDQSRQGVATAIAMDGTSELAPGEKFAVSFNLGAYGGQTGFAGGVAFRVADHVSFNGSLGASFQGGPVGGRAGVRLAW